MSRVNQGDLAGAAATVSRELAAASQAPDRMAIYYAYSNRAEVYFKTAEKCDFQRAFEPCYEALDRSRDDVQQTLAIARKFGWTDVYVQRGTAVPVNVSVCDGVRCLEPALSPDGRKVAFVKAGS